MLACFLKRLCNWSPSILFFSQVESTEVHIKTSDKPEHAIIEAADKGKATYIVSGSRGMGLLRRTILGSTSDFILHHAHCPVLICKAQ